MFAFLFLDPADLILRVHAAWPKPKCNNNIFLYSSQTKDSPTDFVVVVFNLIHDIKFIWNRFNLFHSFTWISNKRYSRQTINWHVNRIQIEFCMYNIYFYGSDYSMPPSSQIRKLPPEALLSNVIAFCVLAFVVKI